MFYNDPFDDDDDGSHGDFMRSLDYWGRNKDRFFQDNPRYRPPGWSPMILTTVATEPRDSSFPESDSSSDAPRHVLYATEEAQRPEGPLTRGFDEWARQRQIEWANATRPLEQGGYMPMPKDSGPRLPGIQSGQWQSQRPAPPISPVPPSGGPMVDGIADFTGAFMDGAFGPTWDIAMAGRRGQERRRIEDEQARQRSPRATEAGEQIGSWVNVGVQAAPVLGAGYKILKRFF